MLTISKALSAKHVAGYYSKEYSLGSNGYYASEDGKLQGRWYGALRDTFHLSGHVDPEAFLRLAEGKDPGDGSMLIAPSGGVHRAAWDLQFSASKSVSLTALVGGDERVRGAHQLAVRRTLEYAEQYVQVRMGGNKPAQTTAKWLVAAFEHDTSRPVDGYPAPQLHTHAVVFNLSPDQDGQFRALQPHELFCIQKMLTAVYQAELAHELRELGYAIERGKEDTPEIAGYTKEYLAAESPRSREIKQQMEAKQLSGAIAASIIAHQGREEKLTLSPDELRALHRQHAAQFGNQPEKVVQLARKCQKTMKRDMDYSAADAVTFAQRHCSEREAVFEHHRLVGSALRYGLGHYRVRDVEREVSKRIGIGELVKVQHVRPGAPGARYATETQIQREKEIIAYALAGRDTLKPIEKHADLSECAILADNPRRQEVIRAILATRDQTVCLQGGAGTGKCLARRTPILLYCGCIRPVEEIKIGDLLMGPDSKPRRVLSLTHGYGEMFTVKPKKGESYTVNRDHILSVKMSPFNRNRLTKTQGRKRYVKYNGEMVNISIHDYLKRNRNFRRQAKGWRTGVEFPSKSITVEPYFLGVWLGDGHSDGAVITNPDPEIADSLRRYADRLGMALTRINHSYQQHCPTYCITNGSGHAPIRAPRNKLHEMMRALGLLACRKRRSKGSKHIPISYKTNNRSVRLEVLAGILDSDGHLAGPNSYDVVCQHEILADDIVFLARSLGFAAYKRTTRKCCYNSPTMATGTYYRISISGDTECIPVRVARKKALPRQQKKDVLRTGITVEAAGHGEYFGFELDGDGLFVLGDFTVTHNSTSLKIIGEIAQSHGHEVIGLAPTGKAAATLREIGIKAETLHKHLLRDRRPQNDQRFYFVDECSLVSAHNLHRFFAHLRPEDRVLLIGDDSPRRQVGQHTSIEAGRVFWQLQEAGIKTAQLNKIVRQKDPQLLEVVRHLRNGHTAYALSILNRAGKIEEHTLRSQRYEAIAKAFAAQPERTLVVSPDNESRQEINAAIRAALRKDGQLGEEKELTVLASRDLTQAERTLAASYRPGDTLRYLGGSKRLGVKGKEYARVLEVDSDRNLLTVQTSDGHQVRYDPRQELYRCSVFEERTLALSVGDRIQFTAPCREKALSTREAGTVRSLAGGKIRIEVDSGKRVSLSPEQARHLDYGYAMTSHAAQSVTVDRCLVHIEAQNSRVRNLLDRTFAYVASSRPQFELQFFTDNADELLRALDRKHEKSAALSREQIHAHALSMTA